MKAKRLGAAFSSAVLGFSSLLTLNMAGVASAAVNTCTWTGATDLKFSTATNWSGCGSAAPVNGSNLVFDATSLTADKTLNNDLTNLTTGTIAFAGSNSGFHRYKITGNDLTIGGNVSSSSTLGNTFDLNVSLAADTTISLTSGGNVGFGAGDDVTPFTVNTQGHNLSFTGSADSCGLYLSSKIAGSGNLTVNLPNSGAIFAADSASYSGAITLTDGALGLGYANTLTNVPSITVNNGSLVLGLNADATLPMALSLNGAGINQYVGSLVVYGGTPGFCMGGGGTDRTVTFSGSVTLNSDVTYAGSSNTIVSGTYNANGHKITNLAGSTGTFTAGGNTTQVSLRKRAIEATDSQPAQQEVISQGEEVTLDGSRGDTEVFGGGVLMGSGTVGKLTVDQNATVAPGHSPGCMTVSGGLQQYGTYQAQIGGTDPCTGYDQLKVTGTVDLGGTNGNAQGILSASLFNNFKPAAGQSYTIIDNDASDAVQGTFANMAEGSTFKVDGYVMQISYKGGDGNDVVLTVKNVPTTPDTGFAMIKANPTMTLIMSTMAAAGILVIAQKTRTSKAASSRRR